MTDMDTEHRGISLRLNEREAQIVWAALQRMSCGEADAIVDRLRTGAVHHDRRARGVEVEAEAA